MCSSRHGTLGHEARVNTSHLRKLAAVAAAGFVSLGAARDVLPPTFGSPNPSAAAGSDSRSLFYGSFFSGSLFNVGFNADSSLDTATGWDDVTGVGSPVAPQFVAALK